MTWHLTWCPIERRLTQPMGIDFDKEAPAVVLPEGLMCPFNSQNTHFDQKALWGTLLPITTSFRVCDIWRGYWVQVGGVPFLSLLCSCLLVAKALLPWQTREVSLCCSSFMPHFHCMVEHIVSQPKLQLCWREACLP